MNEPLRNLQKQHVNGEKCMVATKFRSSQRSREGVIQGNCGPKCRVFLESPFQGLLRGGDGRGGFHTPVRGTMFVRNGAVTPGPPRECDITFFVKGRPKSAKRSHDSTVAARRVQSVTVPSSRVSHECRSPGLRSPPL